MSENTENTEVETPAAPAKAKPAKVAKERDERNGVTRPKSGTQTGKVWEIADEMSRKSKAPAERKDVLTAADEEGINPATAATQYGRWCKYNGISKATAVKSEKPAKNSRKKAEVSEEGSDDLPPPPPADVEVE